jgi:hypothetical protein
VRTVIAVFVFVLSLGTPAAAQTTPMQRIAFIIRVALPSSLDDPSKAQPSATTSLFHDVTGSLARWSEPPLDGVPVALAVSPALCDELITLDPPEGRPLLRELRKLAGRALLLTVPYADVWLPFLPTARDVERQLADGAGALEACLGRNPSDVLFGQVLSSDGGGPADDLDAQVIDAARAAGIRTVVANGVTQTPVKTGTQMDTSLNLVPFSRVMPALDDDGAIRDAPAGARQAIVVDDLSPTALLKNVELLVASERASVVGIDELADEAPGVSVAFPGDPDIDRRTRDAAADAEEAVADLASILLKDDPLRVRLKAAYAAALSDASADEGSRLNLGEHGRSGRDACSRIATYVRRELAKITLSEGSVTFTARRGSVPVTVENGASYPVKIRVTVRSPKLEFPDGASVVKTISPPGDTITIDALANSSGTFPLTVTLGSREVILARTELVVRSAAANLPVLILTIGGALFLLVVYGRRIGRRHREAS